MKRRFYFTEHSLDEMANDDLEIENVMRIALTGEVIENYVNDKPFPSYLVLGFNQSPKNEPIHVVAAKDNTGCMHIITVYKLDVDKWESDFKTRKKREA